MTSLNAFSSRNANRKDTRKRRCRAVVGVEAMEGRQLMTGGLVSPLPLPLNLPADLNVVSLDVQNLANNQVKVTATLANGGTNLPIVFRHGKTYPGGGLFEITKTDGGTTLLGPPHGGSLAGAAYSDPSHVIASMPIPKIAYGSTIQISTVTTGRAIFTAAAVPINLVNAQARVATTPASGAVGIGIGLGTGPLQEVNTANDSRTVDDLIATSLPVTTATMNLFPQVKNAVANTQIVLNGSNSSITIPGLLNYNFSIPGKSVGIWPITGTYNVNNLVSTSVALGYANGGLEITVHFADNAHALHTSSILPDVGVKNLSVTIDLPLSYNAQYQYFLLGQPNVKVNGNWSLNGPLSLLNGLLPDINGKIQTALASAIAPKLDTLSYQLTSAVHTLTAGGRIAGATIQSDEMILNVETPKSLF